MKKITLALIIVLGMAGAAEAQDVSCGTWQQGASSDSSVMRMVQTGTFTNIPAGNTVEQSFAICQKSAVLERVVMTSTACADCDIAISELTGTGGTQLVMENNTAGALTVNGVAYTIYLNAVDVGATVSASAAGTGDTGQLPWMYVRITNNDGNARTVIVRLYWKSE